MLIKASWVKKVQGLLGLQAVGQVWDEKPSWYFWVAGAPGVFHPTVECIESREVDGQVFHSALISLKCYPFKDSDVFPHFSFEERCFVLSDFFDETNTPRFEKRELVPKNLFNIALVEYTVDETDEIAVFSFQSLDTIRTSFLEETLVRYPLFEKSNHFDAGGIDQRIPAARIGYAFFELLPSLYAFHSKRKPFRLVVSRSPGFEFRKEGAGGLESVDAPDIEMQTTCVVFVSDEAKKDPALLRRIDALCLNKYRQPIYDRVFQCNHFHCKQTEDWCGSFSSSINFLWWSLAESDYKSNLASSCGCE